MIAVTASTSKVGDTLTATVVDRNGEDVSDNVTFQWYANDEAIEGADDETLVVDADLLGTALKVVVTAETGNTFESEETAEVEFRYSVEIAPTAPVVGDTIEATILDEDGEEVEDVEDFDFQWYADDEAIEDATANEYEVTADDLGKAIKVVVTDADDVEYESEETEKVELGVINVVDVDQLKADAISITFDKDAQDIIEKEDLTVQRVDGKGVVVVNKLEWSEDGKTVTATLATPLVDGVEYEVFYGEGAEGTFTASVGDVAYIVIDTASAEQNIKTPIKFTLYDENDVDITSSIKVDSAIDVEIEGVDGAIVTADTTTASTAAVTMGTVGDKAKVTVTYRLDDTVEPAEGLVVCTDPEATVGIQHVRQTTLAQGPAAAETSAIKLWDDGTYCARFESGTDANGVSVAVGGISYGVFFTATDENGDHISYDSYEISSSNDDVASAAIEDNIDTGKYCRINVSGNTEGSANILVKATKNGADYIYTIPVTVTPKVKLVRITAAASRPAISNAIDTDYTGKVTVTRHYSDGTTVVGNTNIAFEVADQKKNDGYSTNLLTVVGEKQGDGADDDGSTGIVHTAVTARGAQPFTVNPTTGVYSAWGSQGGKSYVINATTSDDTGKEFKTTASIKVTDLSQAAWKIGGDGAKVDYTVETKNNVTGAIVNSIDEKNVTHTTTSRLVATVNNQFAGYVRVNADAGEVVTIGNGNTTGVIAEVPAKVTANFGTGLDFTVTAAGDVGEAVSEKNFTVAKNGAEGSAPTATYTNGVFAVTVSSDGKTGAEAATKASYEWTLSGNTITANKDITIANAGTITTAPKSGNDLDATGEAIRDAINGATDKVYNATYDTTTHTLSLEAVAAGEKTDAPTITDAASGITYTAGTQNNGANAVAGTAIANTDIQTALRNALAGIDGLTANNVTVGAKEAGETVGTKFSAFEAKVDATTGNIQANEKTKISSIYNAIKFGTAYNQNGNVYNSAENLTVTTKPTFQVASATSTTVNLDPVNNEAPLYYLTSDSAWDSSFARPGTYSINFYFTMDDKDAQASQNIAVTNSLKAPKVVVKKRVIDSLSAEGVKDALDIACDKTNNTSVAESLQLNAGDFYKNINTNAKITQSEPDSDKWTINYVTVKDNSIFYIVPINATFTTE